MWRQTLTSINDAGERKWIRSSCRILSRSITVRLPDSHGNIHNVAFRGRRLFAVETNLRMEISGLLWENWYTHQRRHRRCLVVRGYLGQSGNKHGQAQVKMKAAARTGSRYLHKRTNCIPHPSAYATKRSVKRRQAAAHRQSCRSPRKLF